MKNNLLDRLLRRELGSRLKYAGIKGIYGDRTWIDELDIIDELGGHTGCVNALRYIVICSLSSFNIGLES